MLEFNEIHRLAGTDKRLPEFAAAEERMAYYELAGINEKYARRVITKNEATAQKAVARARFDELRRGRLLNLEAYASYQKNIKAAEDKLSELIKAIYPGADFEKLLRDALDIIALFEGQQSSIYPKLLDEKLKESA